MVGVVAVLEAKEMTVKRRDGKETNGRGRSG